MKIARLSEVATFTSGGTPSRSTVEYWDGDIPWITGADIAEDGAVTARSHISKGAVSGSSTQVLPTGTVLLVTRTAVGKVGVLPKAMGINQDITGIVPSPGVNPGYLVHFLRASKPRLLRNVRGATIKGIARNDVASLRIPLPPLAEQRRIATILDHTDDLLAKRRQVLAHLDDLTQSIFRQMFGEEPSKATAEELALRIRTGPFGSQLLHSEFVDEGIAVLGLDNVVENEFRWAKRRFITPAKYEQLERYTVAPGDVLISIMGTTGRCVVVPEDIPKAINTKHICAITPDLEQIGSEFLRAVFLWHRDARAHLLRQTKGSIMDGLNMGIIKAMPIPTPSLARQRLYTSRVEKIVDQRAAAQRALNWDNELLASLQSRAFSGGL